MTLSNFIRCVSGEQPVSVTWTNRAGNDYTIYEGDAEWALEQVLGNIEWRKKT